MSKDKILMCPPDFFTVDYVINPWMAGQEESMSLDRAQLQWQALRDKIGEFAEIVTIEPQPELPDMVFTANAGVVYGDKAIANGYDLLDLDDNIGFEGAGDCLLDRRGPWLWTGYGFRTEIEAHAEIRKFFDIEVVSIRLTDARFYHIDTCFCPLTDGFLMYHPPAFDYDSRIAIESRIPPHKRIIVDTLDAGNFACNAVNIGDQVVMNKASDPLTARLMLAGFKVHEVELSEFLKAGGSAKCLTLKLNEPKR
jgi:N-dimethylarginine dimethylaminohydrolase